MLTKLNFKSSFKINKPICRNYLNSFNASNINNSFRNLFLIQKYNFYEKDYDNSSSSNKRRK